MSTSKRYTVISVFFYLAYFRQTGERTHISITFNIQRARSKIAHNTNTGQNQYETIQRNLRTILSDERPGWNLGRISCRERSIFFSMDSECNIVTWRWPSNSKN